MRQETLGWNDLKGETYHMRFKEEEQEYRYFPEPDLVPLHFDEADVEAARVGPAGTAGRQAPSGSCPSTACASTTPRF